MFRPAHYDVSDVGNKETGLAVFLTVFEYAVAALRIYSCDKNGVKSVEDVLYAVKIPVVHDLGGKRVEALHGLAFH